MTDPKLQTAADLAQQLRDMIPPAPHFLAMLEELERRAALPVDREKALDAVGDINSAIRNLEDALNPDRLPHGVLVEFGRNLDKLLEPE